MRFTEMEKGMVIAILNRVYKNVKTGENAENYTTDESLILSFDKDSFNDLENFIKKASKEYYLNY